MKLLKYFAFAILLSPVLNTSTAAETRCLPPDAKAPISWITPYPSHRIIGNLYAVGSEDLSVYLITTNKGHVLINTGLEDSTGYISKNIKSLGFNIQDIKILLTMQAHFDHTAALAEIKQLTGAEMWATKQDARVLEDGGASDAQFGKCIDLRFKPIKVDKILSDGTSINIGETSIRTHLHPGHTEGSSSYAMTVNENGREYKVLIANMGTINPGKKLVVDPTYPGVANDFAMTYKRQKEIELDVWVAAHGGQYGLADKHSPGDTYNPETFVDPEGFRAAIDKLEKTYLDQIRAEQQ